MSKKIKLLMLGTHDSKLGGHIMDVYSRVPESYETQVVTLYGLTKKHNYCFFKGKSFFYWFYFKTFKVLAKLYILFKYGCYYQTDYSKREYCYYDNDIIPFSARKILEKCPQGFVPDIISIHWVSNFITSKTLYELHKLTGAKILINFVDEAPLTGGCHYPVNCDKFLDDCSDCPALKRGKVFSVLQLNNKKKYLPHLPIIVTGAPFDIRLAQQSPLFKNAKFIPSIRIPEIKTINRKDAMKKFNLSSDRFYVLIGASSLNDVRKGIVYSIDAVCAAYRECPNITVLVVGKCNEVVKSQFVNMDCRYLGFLNFDDLISVMAASDCFLSTSLADSGPMMVNYSMSVGTPVVSFDIGVAQDLVVHKQTGYIAKYKDAEDVKNGILYLNNMSIDDRHIMRDECKKILNEKGSTVSIFEKILSLKDLNF